MIRGRGIPQTQQAVFTQYRIPAIQTFRAQPTSPTASQKSPASANSAATPATEALTGLLCTAGLDQRMWWLKPAVMVLSRGWYLTEHETHLTWLHSYFCQMPLILSTQFLLWTLRLMGSSYAIPTPRATIPEPHTSLWPSQKPLKNSPSHVKELICLRLFKTMK